MDNKIEYELGQLAGITCKGSITDLAYSLKRKSVTIYYDVIPVDADGNEISNGIVKRYSTSNVADNKTIVNKTDGSLIDTTAVGYKFDPDTMGGQYDFFVAVAQNVPVKVNDLLLQYLVQAKENNAWMPK